MARALIIEYEGAIYHVFSRGHRGDPIFKSEKDRIEFLKKLTEVIEKYYLEVHCYIEKKVEKVLNVKC